MQSDAVMSGKHGLVLTVTTPIRRLGAYLIAQHWWFLLGFTVFLLWLLS